MIVSMHIKAYRDLIAQKNNKFPKNAADKNITKSSIIWILTYI